MKKKLLSLIIAGVFSYGSYAQDAFTTETTSGKVVLTSSETYLGTDMSYNSDGAKIVNVYPNSPAEGSLRTGDIITSVGKFDIRSEQDYQNMLKSYKPGDDARISFLRKGKKKYVKLTFDKINVYNNKS